MTALVMGILNVTPDSFSDGGLHHTRDAAIAHGRALAAQGADIVDVGGESTRPGAEAVAPEEELRRVLPVVRALAEAGIVVSIDTIHARTAEAAVEAGARYINDVSGGTHDSRMYEVAARAGRAHGARLILGHWRGVPDPAHQRSGYGDVVTEVRDWLLTRIGAARAAGVDPGLILLDPGLGFDKTGEQCWELLARLDVLRELGHPVLVGASRKRMIADALERIPAAARGAADAGADPRAVPHERDLATAVVSALAARAGAWGVRVHDVPGTVQALAVEHAWSETARRAAPVADRIALTGLEVRAHHGVFDFEREQGQRFLVDAELAVDLSAAAAGDALERTVHYGDLADAIVSAVERDPVALIETVADRVAEVVCGFAGVRGARITVHKPEAPIRAVFADVSVTVVRGELR